MHNSTDHMKHTEPTIHANILDTYSLLSRMGYLEDKLADLLQTKDLEGLSKFYGSEIPNMERAEPNNWVDPILGGSEGQELRVLRETFDVLGSCDGQHLINDEHIVKYAMQKFQDEEGGRSAGVWPYQFIDWDKAAAAMLQGYKKVTIAQRAYWFRVYTSPWSFRRRAGVEIKATTQLQQKLVEKIYTPKAGISP